MRLPLGDGPIGLASFHEALVIAVVTYPLATAIARNVLQHFRMASREFVDLLNDRHRA